MDEREERWIDGSWFMAVVKVVQFVSQIKLAWLALQKLQLECAYAPFTAIVETCFSFTADSENVCMESGPTPEGPRRGEQ